KLYDLRTGKERAGFQGPMGRAFYLAFSGDGKVLASANGGTTVSLCDLATGQEPRLLGHVAPVDSVAASPDGQTVATGAEDGAVRLWDIKRPSDHATLQHPGRLIFVAFSPDGKRLISGGQQMKVWDLATEQARADLAMERLHLPVSTDRLAISPDCKLLASWDGAGVKLWDVATGQMEATIPGEPGVWVLALAFSPDGKTLAIASNNRSLRLWDVATQRVRAGPVPPRGWYPYTVAFSSDGKYFASGDAVA